VALEPPTVQAIELMVIRATWCQAPVGRQAVDDIVRRRLDILVPVDRPALMAHHPTLT
jgi:hypothetical protein